MMLPGSFWLQDVRSAAQQVALETLFEFTENTKLEYAYQMLLLLVMLNRSDENGQFLLEEAALMKVN